MTSKAPAKREEGLCPTRGGGSSLHAVAQHRVGHQPQDRLRREFTTPVGGAPAWPVAAHAQLLSPVQKWINPGRRCLQQCRTYIRFPRGQASAEDRTILLA